MYKTKDQRVREILLPMNRECNCSGIEPDSNHKSSCNYAIAREKAEELAQKAMDEENHRNEMAVQLRGQPSLTYWWDPEAQHSQCREKGAWVLDIGDEDHGRRFLAMVEPTVYTPQEH